MPAHYILLSAWDRPVTMKRRADLSISMFDNSGQFITVLVVVADTPTHTAGRMATHEMGAASLPDITHVMGPHLSCSPPIATAQTQTE